MPFLASPAAVPLSPPKTPYVCVVLDRAAGVLEKELTYAVPAGLKGELRIGQPVQVPLRTGRAVAFITGFPAKIEFEAAQLRAFDRVLAEEPLFDLHALKLARWMSSYYHCPLADCLCCFIPAGGIPSLEVRYRFCAPDPLRALRDLGRSPKLFAIANAIYEAKKPLFPKELDKILDSAASPDQLKKLCDAGVLEALSSSSTGSVKPRMVASVRISPTGREKLKGDAMELLERAPKQAAAIRALAARDGDWTPAALLLEKEGVETATLRALAKKELVEFVYTESRRAPQATAQNDKNRVQLTAEQQSAVAAIEETLLAENGPKTVLLQGVTASGKTEVYLAAIEKCLRLGRRAMVLVPEIALTAQTVEIFQRRFGRAVAILHSALSAGERFDEWHRAGTGDAQIVVGARSAVFAPCREVGLIIIDEEHDHSYKQDATPRYHAREVALRRAAAENAVLLLGSATPSLESYHRATKGEYRHVLMRNRVAGRKMPEVEIVDMTNEARGGRLPVLSTRLKDDLCEIVAKGEQAILFLNRRGYATYVQCLGCGHVEKCPNCDVSLTHHKAEGSLRCHHCDHCVKVPERCPKCDGWMLGFSGSGTEKVEAEVLNLFEERSLKSTRILRLDRDTTTHKGSHGKILGEFRAGRAQVLIGTQMVTKGLDFPKVTLVGVISADTALNVPDFRAAERTFQLLAQVSGRAGRGETPGRVLIQTLAADDYAISTACRHDFEGFVKQEIRLRAEIPNPPFSHVVNVISFDGEEAVARTRMQKLAVKFNDAIAREGGGTELLGPVDCPLARVKNKFRFHLLLRDRSRPRLHRVLAVFDELSREDKEGLTVDVDAMTIL